jgi:SAM-dependent methyltransferase
MKENFEIINGIKCYAPKLALENADFPADGFKFLYEAEETNFWFLSRNRVIQHLFKKYVGTPATSVLEIGCGTGYVLKGLEKKFPNYVLKGSEIYVEGIKFAQKRLPNVEFVQLDATEMPFENEFDAIGAFDVLEHIEEDEKVMQEVHKALKNEGHFVISVPQYQWMWSHTDDIAFHKRRYHRKELKSKLKKAGFEVEYIGSFVFTLFPMMYLSRLLKKSSKNETQLSTQETKQTELNELKLNPALNSLFLLCMKLDEWLIKLGLSLPWGGSLIAVAKKR